MSELGSGADILVLHGGAGPSSVAAIAAHLSGTANVVTPTHPGWDGTPRPAEVNTIGDLAEVYLRLLDERELRDVVVVGSSIGGWIAAEMAVRDSGGRLAGLVLIDAVGIRVDDAPIRDIFALTPAEVARYSWHDPDRARRNAPELTPAQAAVRQANMRALRHYAGEPYMHNPDLAARLRDVTLRTLLLWGASDGIATPAYAAAYAAAFPDARLEIIADAGHLPHLERPESTFAHLDTYLREL
ncbi:alpha/beta fold hydrolase [Nocardia niigatensis]|uniref:alpha/beta fold hydrolase n=1 Tax=Nocardia niigatensis TaxID=209249 RepID=UPI00068783F3|nr:alpha/beta hydrolase [Nocardia niigatensis]